MSKFVIECPNCGKFAEAKTGFFARKHIDCACGYTINIKTDKLASRVCPHCKNNIVFDQSKGDKAKCPVCHEPINTMAEQSKTVEFSCAQCGVRLTASKSASTYICPVCDHLNDVAERAKTEQIKRDGLASVLKYEGDNETLVWKHPVEDFTYGTQLIVHESQEAIFFKDGQALDLFGAGRYTLETQQLPLLGKIYKLPTDTDSTFHSEVYYINLATQMGIKWGTDSKVRLFDPASGLHIELGACGEFNIRVANARKLLLKVVGTTNELAQEQLLGNSSSKCFFRSMVMAQVKTHLARSIKENQINILEIDEHLITLSEALRKLVNERLTEYGLEMPEFFVTRILTPDDDPNFNRMKQQYAEQYLGVREEQIRRQTAEAAAERMAVEAQTAARMRIIDAQGSAEALKIKAMAEAEAYKAQAYAEAEGMHAKGNYYQQETARLVGLEAMQNGITGGTNGSIGEIAGLGVALGTMGSVVNMTKEAVNPILDNSTQMGQGLTNVNNGWSCACGAKNIQSKFCPDCGAKKPEEAKGWDCPNCNAKNISSNFCPECGTKKPEETGWACPNCGTSNIVSKFCPECGTKKPDAEWTCPECGQQGIRSKFCPNCGGKRGE